MASLNLLLYIDPVSGAIVLQAILAAIVGGSAIFWRPFQRLYHRLKGRHRSDAIIRQ